MKNLKNIIAAAILFVLMITACKKTFLDLQPLDTPTEAIYFKTPDHFKAAANDFYNKMIGFKSVSGSSIYDFIDAGSDLTASVTAYGQGAIGASQTDPYWNNPYSYIRATNILIKKAAEYTGDQEGIKRYVAAAYFFRAWQHFFLMKRFGGVPVVTTVLDVTSQELQSTRNSRYQVTDQILKDLDVAIAGLPLESAIATADKGQVSQQAAKAFKARVLLYEATWEKYVGQSTDGDGTSFGAGSAGFDGSKINTYLTEAASLASQVMNDATYSLFKDIDTLSTYFLYNLDDTKSNPKGLAKSAIKEFILKSTYDFNLSTSGTNLTHTLPGLLAPNRKMMDTYLCIDGLPPSVSPLFAGYNKMDDEFKNRDWRMRSLVQIPKRKYWGFGTGTGADYTRANYINLFSFPTTILPYYPDLYTNVNAGYINRKFVSEHPQRADYQESYDYPQIRLAEVYLIYAEAKCELSGGTISDADLNLSINKIRARAYVAPLTNALIAPYASLTMLGEIRRERAIELFAENTRFDDLKRWGIAETELKKQIEGMVISYNGTPTEAATINNPNISNPARPVYRAGAYPYGSGANGALILDPTSNRKFLRINYLFPLPNDQRVLNQNLRQNPGY
ncbi:RagB/SusD family nutrient uptake outer membrane protein [Pedobacter rhodius]|uniref:RagB/SusD family nutrient uptake outer membrane protein n=1 Tax=Pedobacter rhodius TaxID=3004098 RepID=A0ABT4KXK9_9SPHI|nr:RagB/SusD family nutrient uptake outer membrane protein [Pedobacter sp. SJ11]MCZ4223471.1 RagB/SusD family nutrient uptake outer membrane protein [Pedobacter sp. SJ11]